MKLSTETRMRPRPQQYPVGEYRQDELPHLPPPMTINRAKDFPRECKGCQAKPCGWCRTER